MLDTNVVLDAFVFLNPAVQPVVSALGHRQLHWLGTPQTLAELDHVLRHARLGARLVDAEQVLTLVLGLIQLIEVPDTLAPCRWRCTDTSDQKFIDLALSSGARWLLTRDRAVLKLARKVAPAGLLIQVPERWAPPELPNAGSLPQQ